MSERLNISMPEELASQIREAGLPVSRICQRALQDALDRQSGRVINPPTAVDVRQVIEQMIDHSGSILMLALEPLTDEEFYAENPNGFSAAWVVGHLACVADLFSTWLGDQLMFGSKFHGIFNETDVIDPSAISKAASVDPDLYSKPVLLFRLRQAIVKAINTMYMMDMAKWDAPPPRGVPVSLATCGAVWRILAVHIYWHCGELAGSMERFRGTYTLNILPHHFYTRAEG